MKQKCTFTAFLTALTMAASMLCPIAVTAEDAPDLEVYANTVMLLVNEKRAEAGLDALRSAPILNEAAQIRSDELVVKFEHMRPDESLYSTVFDDVAFDKYASASGENMSRGVSTPEQAIENWMNSTIHKENILNPNYNYIGTGVTYENGTYYWIQLFIACDEELDGAYLPEAVSEVSFLLGDVNEDGSIDSSDAAMVLTAAAQLGVSGASDLSETQAAAADVNQDEAVDATDAAYILLYSAMVGAGHEDVTFTEIVSGGIE